MEDLRRPGSVRVLRLLLAAVLAAPLAVWGGAGWFSFRAAVDASERGVMAVTDLAYENASRAFETNSLVLDRMDDMLWEAAAGDARLAPGALHARLAAMAASLPSVHHAWIVRPDGTVAAHSLYDNVGGPPVQAAHDYFGPTRDAPPGTVLVGPPVKSVVDGTRVFIMSRRLSSADGSFRGVAAVASSTDYFDRFGALSAASGASRGVSVALARGDGAILARFPNRPEPAETVSPGLLASARSAPFAPGSRPSAFAGANGKEMGAARRLDAVHVYVVVTKPYAGIETAWEADMLRLALLGALPWLAMVMLSLLALRRTERAERAFELAARQSAMRGAAEDAARQARRLEALGKVTGGVAHDFGNLLSVILGNAERLQRRADGPSARLLGNIVRSAQSAEALTRHLLAFARRQPSAPRVVDFSAERQRFADIVRSSLRGDITLSVSVGRCSWKVEADPVELDICVLNLSVNARDAMLAGGRFSLQIENRRIHRGEIPQAADISGEFVSLCFSDDGTGMSPDVAARAFEPFYTTKEAGRGTGLGLSQVRDFAAQSGGAAFAESAPGAGTRVTVLLPRTTRDAGEADADAQEAVADRPGIRVLMVDDNVEVAEIGADMLRDLGYEVDVVDRARAGLESLGERGDAYDVLMSDLVMPDGMDGMELARRAKARNPDLPIILVTGWADPPDDAAGFAAVLQKPIHRADISAAVRAAVSGRTLPAASGAAPGAATLQNA